MPSISSEQLDFLRQSCDACFGASAVWPLIEHAYSEPQRFYHTLVHLSELFEHLAPFRQDPLWPAIELAVWGHDVVYATTLPAYKENESLSAQWLAHTVRKHCSRSWQRENAEHVLLAGYLILATKLHRVPDQLAADPILRRAAELFLDADLAILAAPPARLLEYDRAIAQEWAQDPDFPSEAFRAGRHQGLEQLQSNGPLFHSAEFAPLERLARVNLAMLIQRYSQPA
jgi:predicted metal-dependent HD superfamily phosphohydrolase